MYVDLSIEEAFKVDNATFVDLRSPKEYEIDTIPGAVNIPLFNDEERDKIGKVYMEQGARSARRMGLEFASVKLPMLVDKLLSLKNKGVIILFCWRGGDRSKAVAKMLDIMHIPCFRLEQGYRDYRQYVHRNMYEKELHQKFLVLHGLTGVGKTEIINRMAQTGYPVLDLESMANHKGSVFGAVGMEPQPSQKKFESIIWNKISKLTTDATILIEGESKKIGKLYVPDTIFQGMTRGRRILVYDNIENRVKRLIDNYANNNQESLKEIAKSSYYLSRKLGKVHTAKLQKLLLAGDLTQFVTILLKKYYDVLYGNNIQTADKYDLIVDAGNFDHAIKQIGSYIYQLR